MANGRRERPRRGRIVGEEEADIGMLPKTVGYDGAFSGNAAVGALDGA